MRYIILTIILCSFLPGFITWEENAEETINPYQGKLVRAEEREYYYKEVELSAYTLREEECDSDPFIGAMNTDLRFETKTFASNQLPLGAQIEYNGEIWTNQDRMSKRYKNNIDLCFKHDLKRAREFGRKVALIKVYK